MNSIFKNGFLVACALMALPALAQSEAAAPPAWSEEATELFATLPVQEGGRLKPMDTFAGFKMLKLHGKRSMRLDGVKRMPTEWLMDCILQPEAAKAYPLFRVDDSDVVTGVGLPAKKKRDYYSYNELAPGRTELLNMAHQYARLDRTRRTRIQDQVLNLAHNVREFEALTQFADFARRRFALGGEKGLGQFFEEEREYRVSEILPRVPKMMRAYHGAGDGDEAAKQEEAEAIQRLLGEVDLLAQKSEEIALFPPAESSNAVEWRSPFGLIEAAFTPGGIAPGELRMLTLFESLCDSREPGAEFEKGLGALSAVLIGTAREKEVFGKIELEVAYYRAGLALKSLVFYMIAFLLVAISWMRPGRFFVGEGGASGSFLPKLGNAAVFAGVLLPTVLLAWAITMRCIIRSRPPVTTLYETILFVTFVAVAVALVIELINRRKVAVSLAAVMGLLGLFLANKYEMNEGVDTMPSMVAVLDTNFWLATHVTTVTMGYAAGLLAGGLAHIYLLGRLFGFKKGDKAFYRDMSRMTYGVLCFSLLFSIVGTVLGGIWANESWGRFWGWDPKENGALMIVLWQLAVLHARRGGYIRDFGVNMAAVFGGIVVAFSWFGVNLLGVGLHSYGFTDKTYMALMSFYAIEFAVLLLGGVAYLREPGDSGGNGASISPRSEAEG